MVKEMDEIKPAKKNDEEILKTQIAALCPKVKKGDFGALTFAMRLHIDPNAKDADGNALLHLAILAERNKEDMVRFLIDKRANVNEKNAKGYTPLHYAAKERNVNITEQLLAAGANPNAKIKKTSSTPSTPLDYAIVNGNYEVAETLLLHGSHVSRLSHEALLEVVHDQNTPQVSELSHTMNLGGWCQDVLGIVVSEKDQYLNIRVTDADIPKMQEIMKNLFVLECTHEQLETAAGSNNAIMKSIFTKEFVSEVSGLMPHDDGRRRANRYAVVAQRLPISDVLVGTLASATTIPTAPPTTPSSHGEQQTKKNTGGSCVIS